MNPISGTLSVLSGLIFLYAFYPYIRAIVRKEARPRKATWLVWAAGDIIVLSGMIASGTISGQMVAASLGATSVFLLSMKYGEPGWTTRDKVCIVISSAALILWQVVGESNVGIGLSLVALAVAAWPTYVSAWEDHRNEDRKAWFWFNLSSVFALAAIPGWAFADYAPAVAFFLIDSPMIYLLFIRPRTGRVSVVR